ncbi:MAG: LytTR family DNA-binding domain-containing protein [Bacteroidota bacterium]
MEKQWIFINKKNRFERVWFHDILWASGRGSSTAIFVKDPKQGRKQFLYSANLKTFSQRVPDSYFLQIHRSHLINPNKVEAIDGKRLVIDGVCIPYADRYKNIVERRFPKLKT